MQSVVIIVSVLATLGAVACWVVGARAQASMLNTLPAEHRPRFKWPLIAVWPFARGRLQYAAADQVQLVNKSLIACVMVALSAASLATNLTRFSR
jgi:hypothetical protein